MRKFIFLWFLVSVLLVSVISTIGALWTGRSIRLAMWSFYASDLVHYSANPRPCAR